MPALGTKRFLAESFAAKPDIGVVASDITATDESIELLAHFACSPRTDSSEFVEWARGFCCEQSVSWIIPTRDAEMLQWAKWADSETFAPKILVSQRALMESWNGKAQCAQWLEQAGLPHPGWLGAGESLESHKGPIILKPTFGAASQGVRVVDDGKLPATVPEGYGAQRLIQGPEYTINLFFDPEGSCHAIIPHQRLATRDGEVSHGVTVDDPDIIALGEVFARSTGGQARGPINFQAIRDQDTRQLYITDINPRFGGGYPLTHKAGGEFTRWIVEAFIQGNAIANTAWKAGVELKR